MTMKILLLSSQHGNELLGEMLYAYIKTHHSDLLEIIDYKLANPEARKVHVRFIESDLNRSYVDNPQTYEEKLADGIERLIQRKRYDLVLDLHTTTVVQPACLILFSTDENIQRFVNATTISNVVLMHDKIVKTSLIGKVSTALSIELSDAYLDTAHFEELVSDIRQYMKNTTVRKNKRYFKVIGLLNKGEVSEAEMKNMANFKLSKHGFYPVLVGEDAYKQHTHYLGFKARRIPTIKPRSTL